MTGIVVVWNLFGLDVLDINCHYEARVSFWLTRTESIYFIALVKELFLVL